MILLFLIPVFSDKPSTLFWVQELRVDNYMIECDGNQLVFLL